MIKSKFKRVASLCLGDPYVCDHFCRHWLDIQHMLLSGEKADVYMVDFPRDGDANYDGVWGHSNLTLEKWLAYRHVPILPILRLLAHTQAMLAYCIEPGISHLSVGQTMNKYDENYFNNLAANGVISGDEIRLFRWSIFYSMAIMNGSYAQTHFPLQVMGCRRQRAMLIIMLTLVIWDEVDSKNARYMGR